MTRPAPVLIGFFPKKTARPDSWFGESCVRESCSVSDCISPGPKDWINRWKHNMTWWLFDTEQVAWEVAGQERPLFDMYAYRLFPVVFDGLEVLPVPVESTAAGDLSQYDFLGYDPVSREGLTPEFGHSPLSCNRGFEQYPVNRFCLLDDLDFAWRAASDIARDARERGIWEPGPYYLCEVHRRRKTESDGRGRVHKC